MPQCRGRSSRCGGCNRASARRGSASPAGCCRWPPPPRRRPLRCAPRCPRTARWESCARRPSPRAVGHQDRQRLSKRLVLHVVAVAVLVVLAGDVARQRVAAVGPPEGRAVVGIERQHLVGQRPAAIRLHAEVAVEQVVDLGAVFQEVAVADALVADAVADHQVLRAVDRDPAVVRIDDRRADHAAAAHRVASKVEVDRVAAQHPFLAQVSEPGVADASLAERVIERVAADAVGIGAFDDHVPREIGHFAAELALAGSASCCQRLGRGGSSGPSIAVMRRFRS
jgi:hypothetical protein